MRSGVGVGGLGRGQPKVAASRCRTPTSRPSPSQSPATGRTSAPAGGSRFHRAPPRRRAWREAVVAAVDADRVVGRRRPSRPRPGGPCRRGPSDPDGRRPGAFGEQDTTVPSCAYRPTVSRPSPSKSPASGHTSRRPATEGDRPAGTFVFAGEPAPVARRGRPASRPSPSQSPASARPGPASPQPNGKAGSGEPVSRVDRTPRSRAGTADAVRAVDHALGPD